MGVGDGLFATEIRLPQHRSLRLMPFASSEHVSTSDQHYDPTAQHKLGASLYTICTTRDILTNLGAYDLTAL
jgi:hypothetical protein